MLPLLLLLAGDTDPAAIYNGRAGRLDVHPPRLEAEVTVDGVLDEPATARALAAVVLRALDCGAADQAEIGLDRAALDRLR